MVSPGARRLFGKDSVKVLNVNDMLDPVTGGGTAERTFQMSRALAKAGAVCAVLTSDLGLTSERICELGATNVVACPSISRRFFIPRITYRRIREIVKQADIVHLMGHWSALNAIVYFVASRLNKPYVVCPAGALPVYGRSRVLKRIYNWIVGNKLIRRAACCIAITEAEIPQFQNYGVPRDRIVVIPNGIVPDGLPSRDPAAFREKYALGSAPIILFVGRLNHIKGPDLLLQAFCNLKDALKEYQLVFVGPDGGMLEALRETANRHGIAERVRFLGYVGGSEKYQAYFASDLLVIPSRQEAMSIVVLEAGITGTPVLLTDQCGFNEVENIQGGRVTLASVYGLEKGLFEVLRNPSQLKPMGEKLKKYIAEHFAWDSIVNEYLELYRQYSKPQN